MVSKVTTYALAAYAIAGVAVITFGPVYTIICKEISAVRGSPFVNALTGRAEVPVVKLFAFRLILCVVFGAIWPAALWSSWREKALQEEAAAAFKRKVAEGLTFCRMGGGGTICCGECGYSEQIVCFTHGHTEMGEESFTAGLQCLSCGKFVSVSNDAASVNQNSQTCDCGGQLSSEHVLFCPQCRSKKLTYDLQYIT